MARYGWLASYPRSGNTWLRLMLLALQAGTSEVDINALERGSIGLDRRSFDDLTGADSEDLRLDEIDRLRPFVHRRIAEEAGGPLLLCRTHDRWRTAGGLPVIPPEVSAGIAYVVRDPRDVAVSLAHYEGLAIDDAIARLADSTAMVARHWGLRLDLPQPLGSWSEHVESWLDACPVACAVIRYEDMLAAPERELEAMAHGFGLAVDRTTVEAVVHNARIERLQAQERDDGYRPRPAATQRFFRSGRAGEWRDVLTSDQARRIEQAHGTVMGRLGYL